MRTTIMHYYITAFITRDKIFNILTLINVITFNEMFVVSSTRLLSKTTNIRYEKQ